MSKSIEIDNLENDVTYGFRIFPRNLKGQYQTETDGATATATPKAIDPIFGNNTWEVINLASTTNTIPSTWHVGDTKDITLTTGETLTMQIYGFNHDDLADGSGKAGITLGMKNLTNFSKEMNSSNTNKGGFTAAELYSWIQNNLFDSLPSDLKPYIKLANKKTSAGSESSNINVNSMKTFLFSEIEIFGEITHSFVGEGNQYKIFENPSNRIKRLESYTNIENWWQRSPYAKGTGHFCFVSQNGLTNYASSNTSFYLCFGFCI